MTDLDPLRLPLTGRRLIEASAGTGKTHAIGSLLLRALLGHGGDGGDGEPTTPIRLDRVLIVTFTRAATMELRDRIRGRILAARDAFAAGESSDPFLGALIADTPDHERAVRLLGAALGQLDEAAIFTIHGFCQRILQESAFESGAVFDQAFVLDDSAWHQQAARDFWRREIYPLDPGLSAVVRQSWPDPDALLGAVRSHTAREGLVIRGDSDLELAELGTSIAAALHAVKRVWREQEVRAGIEASRISTAKTGPGGAPMLDAVDAWSGSDEFLLTHLTEEGTRQSVEKLLAKYARKSLLDPKNLKQKGPEPDLNAFFDVLEPALDGLARIGATVRARAIRAIRDGVEADKRADRMIAPDDVLRQTARGLTGPHGERFARHVRSRYPLAFIDEFQDTDPLQYRIFDELYPEAGPENTGALVMIGDPKQAIYAFRGADIHAYLQARAELPEQARVQMAVNWRSSPEMLAAIQALYDGCRDPFATEDIGFIPVAARPGAPVGGWRRGDEPAPALTFWHRRADTRSGVLPGGAAREALAGIAAAELARLLDGETRIGEVPLRPGDVTLLVNDRYEAELARTALREVGIASVWQSREPVFATPEAQDLRRVLAGALDPRDERAVRAALSTRLLDLSLERLYLETLADDGLWQVHLDRFGHYHELWRDHGVMVMLRALLTDYRIPPRLLATPDGARRLTDLRHLGEVLQTRAVELGSMHRLLRFFARQVEEPEADETSQLRLESDGDLVRVATVHGSKGLEYPVVMLPFGIRARSVRDALFHEHEVDDWRTVLDLMPDDSALARAEQERMAETLRLLYVALTRARHACFVGIANQSEGQSRESAFHRTALGHLLLDGAGEPVDDDRIAAALAALAEERDEIRVETLLEAESELASVTAFDRSMARREPFRGSIERGWSVTSYSALVAGGHVSGRDAPLRPGAQDEVHLPAGEEGDPAALAAADAAARFPRGARPGSCLHELLETWPEQAGAETGHVGRVLARWGLEGTDAPAEAVTAWLRRVRTTPLGIGTDLAGVGRSLVEMEFHLPLAGLDSSRLQQALGAHGHVALPLARDRIEGMLRGFIDLVIEHEGRFWVVDYKSNWLGTAPAAYDEAATTAAVREHRYDLQYLLYSVALRRLLRQRLPGVDVNDHFGGVLYLFLRGMDGSGRFGIHRDRPEPALLDAIEASFDVAVTEGVA